MIEACTLYSGSSGNALLLRSGRTAVLMDAGKSRRALLGALAQAGCCAADIAAVFVTHEHTDHTSALEQLAKHEGMPVHACAGTADVLAMGQYTPGVLVRHGVLYTERVGCLTVTSFPLPHDSRCHVGYIFRDEEGDAFCAATDMGCVTEEVLGALRGCRGALLEANHDVEMLRCGPYPAYLKARILAPTGHLSNGDCASLARYAAENGVVHIALGHLSAENNTPALARQVVEAALGGTPVETLSVCARDRVTRVL
ncbi:MAG: MBL fold metallo-hydrolase [Eubacteriales bacterium]